MSSIKDERGYNQGFKETRAVVVRTERRVDAIVREFDLTKKDSSVLELGCGTGLLSKMIQERTSFRTVGVDLSQNFVDEANQKYGHDRLTYLKIDLSAPGLSFEKFDYIVGNGILHHLYHHLDSFMADVKRFLKPGGKLVFWEPNLYNPYVFAIFKFPVLRKMAKLEPDEMAFTPNHIFKILKATGYQDIQISSRDFLLPNTPDSLINTMIKVGGILERFRLTSTVAQSLFISARSSLTIE